MDWTPKPNGEAANHSRTLTYWQHCADLSGVEVAGSKWAKDRASSLALLEQTRFIAERLRSVGIDPERKSDGVLSIVGVATGQWEIVPSWRKVNFLPAVAAANRSQLIKKLAFLGSGLAMPGPMPDSPQAVQTAPLARARARVHNARAREAGPVLRYLVVTNGTRCRVEHLRARLQNLAREVSRWAAQPQLAEWGITVELRVSEITAEREPNGIWSYHPHANVIISCSKFIDWQAFLAFTTRHLSGHWRDCGRLVDPAEAVKYFVKPADVLAHRPLELAFLFQATFGLRMATPMGNLKLLGLALKERRVKLAKRLDADRETWRWCFVKLRDPKQHLCPPSADQDNRVLGLLPPQPRFCNRFEPVVLVRNFRGDAAVMLQQNELDKLFAVSRTAFDARASIRFTPSPQLPDRIVSKTSPQTFKPQLAAP